MSRAWWEEFPERLAYEQQALEAAKITYRRDEEAFARGILRWHLQMPLDGQFIPLDVTFSDLHPFFRFQVEAPTRSLPHHQNPFGKNLCLIGRATHYWNTTDTVASLLQEQLSVALRTGECEDRESVRGLEQQQAEPFSDYYPYPPSLVILPSSSAIPPQYGHGTFSVATVGSQGPPPERFVRGLVVQVRAHSGEVIADVAPDMVTAFPDQRLEGTWVRLSKPIPQAKQDLFLKELLAQFPVTRSAHANRVEGGWLQIWGVLFPEEARWRACDGEGWVFVCLFDAQRSGLVRDVKHPERRSKGRSKRTRKRKR